MTNALLPKYIAEAVATAEAAGATAEIQEYRSLGRGQGFMPVASGGSRIVLTVTGEQGTFWASWSRPYGEGKPSWDGAVNWTTYQGKATTFVVKGSYKTIALAVQNAMKGM